MVSKKELREDVDNLLFDIRFMTLGNRKRDFETDQLREEIELIKLNREAEVYDVEFVKNSDMFDVYKEWELYRAFQSLNDLRKRFAWYESWIDDLIVTFCDDCIDSCLESAKHQEEWEKVLSSKKK